MLAGPEEIAAAVARLKSGGVVAFPTETVYGLGADALNERAVARVFELKGRPGNNPLIVHVSGAAMAACVVAAGAWSREADLAARAFWPGPLSIVLPKGAGVPGIVTGGGPNVAVRCPDHPVTLALLEAFGGPLVGPSANMSGRVSPTRAEHVREAFSEGDVLVLDGGACRGGIESTVLSLVDASRPRVLRPGLIGAEEIGRVIGRGVEVGGSTALAGEAMESPGQLESHYAPAARAVLFDAAEVGGLVTGQGRGGRPVVFLTWSGLGGKIPSPSVVIGMSGIAAEYAAGLYAALREADGHGPSLIAIERPPAGGSERELAIWGAVMDRVTRACAGRR